MKHILIIVLPFLQLLSDSLHIPNHTTLCFFSVSQKGSKKQKSKQTNKANK